ncbi:uncharacterized protein LOC143919995 isoform X1 [Arctopsyche grandis]|uniref:uncharacterized protein LOC143919995 isoform X1 n=1 Tax=Arctopsyche grandis TaxID=121162 RepID=UPI00406D6DE1
MECRLCLFTAPAEHFVSIHNNPHPILQRIRTCCQLQIEKCQGFPDTICLSCDSNLKLLSNFRDVCFKSNETSKQRFTECLDYKSEEVLLEDLIWDGDDSINNLIASTAEVSDSAENIDLNEHMSPKILIGNVASCDAKAERIDDNEPQAMAEEIVDIEMLIPLVEDRPVLWDKSLESYQNRVQTRKTWKGVCKALDPKFADMNDEERKKFATQIQRKWKSLRDSYKRERIKQKYVKSGAAASGRKQYLYLNQLSFLSVLAETKPDSLNQEQGSPSPAPVPGKNIKKKSRLMSNIEKTEQEVLQNISENIKIKKAQSEDDADRGFLLSLLPFIKNIHVDVKLDAMRDILRLLKKYNMYKPVRNPSAPSPHCGYHPQTHTFAPAPSHEYASTCTPIPTPSHHALTPFDSSPSYCPTTPSPAAYSNSSNHSDNSIIDDMFFE